MHFNSLKEIACERIAQMGYNREAKLIAYAHDYKELHSSLREYVFRKDTATELFLKECMQAVVIPV